ncbi:UDP-glucuronosyltransferase 2C1-like isoform X1 [Ovis aries]|uniref:UDP-glucuronosyltransferase 2C1-like isoform X1 n=1 Tax=Ovis aries TaxID=9940 RepID=UPI001C2E3507|nr:UDP-glucuronosyltransferase 2C1-like isoform X1 [Ovis aries]
MKTVQSFCILFVLQLCLLDSGRTGKVLVWPMDFSHWINLQVILEELHLRGHEITLLVPSQSLVIDRTKIPYHVEILQVSVTEETFIEELNTMLYEEIFELPKLSWWEVQIELANLDKKFLLTSKRVCDSAITNKELLSRLQAAKFDVCIADPLSFCGELVSELLNIPFIYTFRFFSGNVIERLCAGLPMPSSYVPGVTSRLTDKMTFIQRLENWLLYTVSDIIYSYYVFPEWDEYYSKVLGKPTTLCETMGKADMWLFRSYWDFEFPQPYLPNTEFVGGLHCKPAKPLPKELEEFVQSSGEDGVVVFTLGSMIKNLSEEKSNMIASALAQIPQKVLWRYTGKKPETLGANTRLYEWIPQNDLLGHPKTRAFITHCGTNGIYEAIYHGIPMVGIPLFGDQHDNVARMKAKGAAVAVDLQRLTSADLLNALKAVINNPSYKKNAMKLSRIHHDQPVKPLDRAVFWVEFVMRHKGAKHLRPAFYDLNWFQHHSFDVIGFLLACVATVVFLVTKCCLFCYWKFGKPTTLCEIMGKADMWLFRSYWDFEFPQPYLPNTEFVGGLHCKPAKPLPKEFEEFVQSSGKDGVVVFTLGSMIKNLSEEKSNMIASALAQIPQKVLWRYTGKKPDTLGANTRLYEWIPQNDLLGHPKTRAFITHCGTNGIYEAIYHGVPMVGIPLFGDQHDNVARMKAKGAAVEVDLRRMTSEDLLNALKAVINNPFYKENAMKLSRIHHDQPVKPLDRAVFWVEFVMRHKGAKHLRPAFHDLTWFQQNSLDVIGFLLACVATVVFLVTKCCLFCYWKFGKTAKKKKRE